MRICWEGERTSPFGSCPAVAKGESAGWEAQSPPVSERPPVGIEGPPCHRHHCVPHAIIAGHTVQVTLFPVPALPCPAQPAEASSTSRPLLAAPWTRHPRFLPQGQAHYRKGPWEEERGPVSGLCDPGPQPLGHACRALTPGRTPWCRTF